MIDSINATLERCEELVAIGEARAAAEVAMQRLRDMTTWMEEVPEAPTE